MSLSNPTIPSLIHPVVPTSVPFVYRDGLTMLQLIERIKHNLDDLQMYVNGVMDNVNKALEDQTTQNQGTLDKAQQAAQDAADAIKQAQNALDQYQQIVTNVNTALTTANAAIDRLESLGVTDPEAATELKNTIQQTATNLTALEQRVTTAENTLSNVQSLAQTNQSGIARIDANLTALGVNSVEDAASAKKRWDFSAIRSIEDYGVLTSNNPSDNATKMQAAVDDSAATGIALYVPAKTYTFDNPINIGSHTKIVGADRVASVLKFTSSSGLVVKDDEHGYPAAIGVVLDNLTIQGPFDYSADRQDTNLTHAGVYGQFYSSTINGLRIYNFTCAMNMPRVPWDEPDYESFMSNYAGYVKTYSNIDIRICHTGIYSYQWDAFFNNIHISLAWYRGFYISTGIVNGMHVAGFGYPSVLVKSVASNIELETPWKPKSAADTNLAGFLRLVLDCTVNGLWLWNITPQNAPAENRFTSYTGALIQQTETPEYAANGCSIVTGLIVGNSINEQAGELPMAVGLADSDETGTYDESLTIIGLLSDCYTSLPTSMPGVLSGNVGGLILSHTIPTGKSVTNTVSHPFIQCAKTVPSA